MILVPVKVPVALMNVGLFTMIASYAVMNQTVNKAVRVRVMTMAPSVQHLIPNRI